MWFGNSSLIWNSSSPTFCWKKTKTGWWFQPLLKIWKSEKHVNHQPDLKIDQHSSLHRGAPRLDAAGRARGGAPDVQRWIIYIYKVQINPRTVGFMIFYIYIYIYIYRKGRCQVPIFPRFWKCSVFVTSCWILYVHIPVMILLEIHIDYQTSSGVAKECPESHEDSQGKEGGNTDIVCVYIYSFSSRERWPRKKKEYIYI